MPIELHAHPFSSYCQKVLIALYENDTPFELRLLSSEDKKAMAAWEALWPLKRMPVLVDDGKFVAESSIIVEHLDLFHPGRVRLVPTDAKAALDVRFMDRFFDNYVMSPMTRIVFDAIRPLEKRNVQDVADGRALLDVAYRWLNGRMQSRSWASGDVFSLADCAAAPSLFYADWVHPIGEQHESVRAYRRRLLARPSFARAVDEARPYRDLFPLGAPDRD